jgi:hypothetical protein
MRHLTIEESRLIVGGRPPLDDYLKGTIEKGAAFGGVGGAILEGTAAGFARGGAVGAVAGAGWGIGWSIGTYLNDHIVDPMIVQPWVMRGHP